MKEMLLIQNLRIVYEPHWVGLEDGKEIYDYFEIATSHEIEARYLPKELYMQIREFVAKVERAHDQAGGTKRKLS